MRKNIGEYRTMSNERLNIPKQLKVGYQERKDTFSGKLAYVTYIDKKGKVAKHTSWEHWRSKDMDVNDFDNIPTEGFVLNKRAGGYKSGWNYRQTKCRVYDPRGFEIEISVENLLYILQECTCNKGKGLEGEFVYAWQGPELILLPICSEDYKASTELIEKTEKIAMKDLKVGASYKGKESDCLIYIGKLEWYLWQRKEEVVTTQRFAEREKTYYEIKQVKLPTFFDMDKREFHGYKNMDKLDYQLNNDVISSTDVEGFCENFKNTSAYQNQFINSLAINDSIKDWEAYIEKNDNYSWGKTLIMKRPEEDDITVMRGCRNKKYKQKRYGEWLAEQGVNAFTSQEERMRLEKEFNENCEVSYTFQLLGHIQLKDGRLEYIATSLSPGSHLTYLSITDDDWKYISDGDNIVFSFETDKGKKIKMLYSYSMTNVVCGISENLPLPAINFEK